MRFFVLVILSIFTLTAEATDDAPQVARLYDSQSLTPDTLIPFKVTNTTAGAPIKDVVVVSPEDPSICQVMKDPFIPQNFLLKCTGETHVRLRVSVEKNNRIYNIAYGPVEIAKPFTGSAVVTPTDPTVDTTLILAGRQVYQAVCITCHNPVILKAGRKAEQIRAAVQAKTEMQYLKTVLRDGDYIKLEAYLKGVQ